MSAYSDWKCGAISDSEYSDYCAWEDRKDKAAEEKDECAYNCDNYKDGVCILCGQLCNGCE